jgi:MFS transporter, DHA1 family, inner membrane transport protein
MVVALAVALFAYVTVETLPIGLLPQISGDLGVSPSTTGLLVTAYAVVVMAASVPLTHMTRTLRRRPLLSVLLGGFTAGTLLCAVAPDYWVLLSARILIALTHAIFWSIIGVTATGMFPPRLRSRVVAGVFSGASLASVMGVPAGTWLGQLTGWQTPFLADDS